MVKWDKNLLWDLRNEIVLNSLFVADYENSFNIPAAVVCDFFMGYISFLEELERESGEDLDFDSFFDKYDTAENLFDWYCCFDHNPLEV